MTSTKPSLGEADRSTNRATGATSPTGAGPTVGVIMGALGALAAVWAYWLIVPGVVFGIAAIVLGVRARRRSAGEAGSVAIALGVVALLLVPSVLAVVDGAEDWGRNCALNPTDPHC